jgi:very-short-patch-repair endonuclease
MPDCREYDTIRSGFMLAHGIQVVRFWNTDVLNNIQGVLEKLTEIVGQILSQRE